MDSAEHAVVALRALHAARENCPIKSFLFILLNFFYYHLVFYYFICNIIIVLRSVKFFISVFLHLQKLH